MENKKKLIGSGIGLVLLVLLAVLLVTSCGDKPGSSGETEITTAPAEVTGNAAPDVTEEATQAPTEMPTEVPAEATEPTEETEPEEESGSSGGSSRPGGSGGFTGSDTESDPPEEEEPEETEPTEPEDLGITDPGTQTNAYAEVLSQIPEEISSVKIPTRKTIYYNLYNAAGTVLTIADEDAYVVYNGKTYEAVDGVVTVELEKTEDAVSPVSIQIGSKAKKAKTYLMQFTMPVGSMENPEVIEDISELNVSLDADQADGYYYSYTAMQNGTLSLSVGGIAPENAACEIIVTRTRTNEIGETEETVVKLSESEDGAISIDLELGDVITIQVKALPEGTAAEIRVIGTFEPSSGTEDNPTWLNMPEDTIVIPAGKTIYYAARAHGAIMTVTGEGVSGITVTHNGQTYGPVDNAVTLEASNTDISASCLFAISNSGGKAVTCTVTFGYPLGDASNPATLTIGSNTAAVKEGSSGYHYTWTAGGEGDLIVTMDAGNANGWYYCINIPDKGYYGESHYSNDAEPVSSETVSVSEGDVVQIVVNTCGESGTVPAGEVTFTAKFDEGTGTKDNPYQLIGDLEVDLEVGAGKTVYLQCRSLSMLFTLNGTDVEVTHGGVTHRDKEGVVSFVVTEGDMYNPPLFAITNKSDTDKIYPIAFTYVVGSTMNPAELVMGENSVDLEADSEGYVYGWIAPEDGTLTITMDVEKNTAGWIYCVNNLTKAGGYGENHYSHDTELEPSETITVKAGHEIQVVVGTFDPSGVAPAGTVTFTAEFVPTNPAPAAEATEPEVTEPEITEPEVTEPAATEPEATEPEATEPEATEPEVTEPEGTEPEVTEPAEPEATEPEPTEPEATEPESTEPAEPEAEA